MKILIVDDNRDDRRVLKYIVINNGHEVVEAEDGLDGLRKAKINSPDLIISDALMPIMDGFQFLRSLKQDENLRSIPFIFYSATYRGNEDVQLALSLGADAYIIKPKDPVELWDEVAQIITEGKEEKVITAEVITEESEYLKRYSQVVATKLEEKVQELEQALEALRVSEEKYRRIVDTANEGIWMLGPDTLTTFVNAKMAEMLDYRVEEMLGKPLTAFMFDEDVPDHLRKIEERRLGMSGNYDRRFRCRDGRTVWTLVSAVPVVDAGHNFMGSFGMFTDITERRKTEQELKKSETFLSNIVENIPNMLFVKDATALRFVRFNKAGEQLLGYSREELLGKNDYDLFPREEADFFTAKDREVLSANELVDIPEESIRMRDKTERILHTKKIPIPDESGEPLYLLGISEDITERKRAEKTLYERDAFISNILETVDEGFIVVDRQYRILSANKAFCRSAKLPEEQVLGRYCYEVSHHSNRPCFEVGEDCAVKQTFDVGTPHSAAHTHVAENGEKVHVEIKSYPVRDASGSIVSAIETITDVTEKRNLEEQLRHAQKLESLGTLAGGVAHDFNNILSVIIGYGDMLAMRLPKDDPNLRYLKDILSAAERATHLTQSLLIFSRKQITELKPVSINDLVSGMKKMVFRIIGEDVETRVHLAPEQMTVMGDYGQLEQVLMNFATNARDAMPEGGLLTIDTQLHEMDDAFIHQHGFGKPGKYALVSVSDTGKGMDEQTRERIFEPFFTTKVLGKGTGLGLSIVYGIIKQHNGYINCYSEPGKGTIFNIYLPVVNEEVSKFEDAAISSDQGGTETILLADDDEHIRRLTKELLENCGYTVIEAKDGAEAVTTYCLNRAAIQLVLLDVIMPGKSGKEAFDEIQRIDPGAKVLFISGYTEDVIKRMKIIEEKLPFLQKPVSPGNLLAKIREILDSRQ